MSFGGGLVIGTVGQVKQGKTLYCVRAALKRKLFAYAVAGVDLPVWSNMKSLVCREKGHPWYGLRWGTPLSTDELLYDLMQEPEDAHIRNGILILDELHHLMSPEFLRGVGGTILGNSVTQLGKRGLCLIFNTHMPRMIGQKVWGLTSQRVHVSTDNHGQSLLVNYRNQQAWNEAYQEGMRFPEDVPGIIFNTWRFRYWYDANEPMSPFALGESVLKTARWKAIGKGFKDKFEAPAAIVSDEIEPAQASSPSMTQRNGGNRRAREGVY